MESQERILKSLAPKTQPLPHLVLRLQLTCSLHSLGQENPLRLAVGLRFAIRLPKDKHYGITSQPTRSS